MRVGPCGDKCEKCGADDWIITATLIVCQSCEFCWGRVEGAWIPDPHWKDIQEEKNDAAGEPPYRKMGL